MTESRPKVCCLMGPTASGKTDLAIALTQRGPFEIISVDSAMVYRGMDIGSAKPTSQELEKAPHALIDIRDPLEAYSAADFRRDALALIEDMHARGKIPLLVGGTMLYFKVLLEGVGDMPATEPEIRAQVEALASDGWPAVHQLLAEVDPQAAERIHPNHSQRIARAYEVYLQTGKPLTQWHAEQSQQHLSQQYDVRQIALMPDDRAVLHARIEKRFNLMLEQGFEDEVKQLRTIPGLTVDHTSMRAVGYRQMWQYLDGDFDRTEMINKGVAATRQLAKRQFTWLRGWEAAKPLPISETPDWDWLINQAIGYYSA